MPTVSIERTINAWSTISETVFVPHTQEDYDQLVELLDRLIDIVGEDESHPLASLMEVMGVLIEDYESDRVPELS